MNGKPKCHGDGNSTLHAKPLHVRFQVASGCGGSTLDSIVPLLDNLSGYRTRLHGVESAASSHVAPGTLVSCVYGKQTYAVAQRWAVLFRAGNYPVLPAVFWRLVPRHGCH